MDQGSQHRSWWVPARFAFATLLGMIVLQALFYYPQLPAQVASHFDAGGRPNGWSSKSAYFALHTFIVLIVAICFAALPAWLEHAPARLVNLPNKDYWLAPERRAATMARVASALTWFGCVGLIFILVVTSLVIDFNLGRKSALPAVPIWALIGGIAVCTVLLILRLLYLGRSPPS
jgi:serine/threonine-protein kinase